MRKIRFAEVTSATLLMTGTTLLIWASLTERMPAFWYAWGGGRKGLAFFAFFALFAVSVGIGYGLERALGLTPRDES